MKKFPLLVTLLFLLTALGAPSASAITLDISHPTAYFSGQAFSAVPGPAVYEFAAEATFTLDTVADTLTLILTNTSSQAVTDPVQLLATVFWDSATTLTPVSAALTSGSAWVNPNNVALNIGGNYCYNGALRQTGTNPAPTNQGVSATGIGLFGAGNFPGGTPVSVDGDAYDILPTSGIAPGHTQAFANKYPLANNSMTFIFTTTEDSIDIDNVIAHYSSTYGGASLPVPLPATALLLGSGLVGLGLLGYRRKRKS